MPLFSPKTKTTQKNSPNFDLTQAILTILICDLAFINDQSRENLYRAHAKHTKLLNLAAIISGNGLKSLKRLDNPDYIPPDCKYYSDPDYQDFLDRMDSRPWYDFIF